MTAGNAVGRKELIWKDTWKTPLLFNTHCFEVWTGIHVTDVGIRTHKIKQNIENVTRCRDSRSAKAGKHGKQFSTQLHPTYLWCGKICGVVLYT